MTLLHQTPPWRYLMLGSLLFFLPLLAMQLAATGSAWQTVGLPEQSVRHVATGFADGLFFYYAWTPTDGLMQASASAPGGDAERTVWRSIDEALPGNGMWGAPELHRLAVDTHNGRHVLVTLAADNQSGLYSSTDGGANWQLMRSFAGSDQNPVVGLGPLGAVYLADNQRLLVNLDGGNLWQQTPAWRAEAGPATVILVSEGRSDGVVDPAQPQVLLGTAGGYILRLPSPLADHWEESQRLAAGAVTLLAEAAAQPAHLYAWGQGALFASTDAGASWAAIPYSMDGVGSIAPSASADEVQAQALVVTADDPATLYLALAGAGIMVSHDRGFSWQPLDRGRRPGAVHALTFDRRGSYLLAATDQGIWRFPLFPAAR